MPSGACHVAPAPALLVLIPLFPLVRSLSMLMQSTALPVSLHPKPSVGRSRFVFVGVALLSANANYSTPGFNTDASYNDLIGGSCTSCQVTQDKSAYWTPALYFEDGSGQFHLVDQVGGMLAYVIFPFLWPVHPLSLCFL